MGLDLFVTLKRSWHYEHSQFNIESHFESASYYTIIIHERNWAFFDVSAMHRRRLAALLMHRGHGNYEDRPKSQVCHLNHVASTCTVTCPK